MRTELHPDAVQPQRRPQEEAHIFTRGAQPKERPSLSAGCRSEWRAISPALGVEGRGRVLRVVSCTGCVLPDVAERVSTRSSRERLPGKAIIYVNSSAKRQQQQEGKKFVSSTLTIERHFRIMHIITREPSADSEMRRPRNTWVRSTCPASTHQQRRLDRREKRRRGTSRERENTRQ